METPPCTKRDHHQVILALRDYVYLLKFPFPGDGAAMKSTVHTLNRLFLNLEDKMTTKKGQTTASRATNPNGNDLKWVNRNLTDEEKKDHDARKVTAKEIGVLLFKVAFDGYNVRIAWDAYSKCFQANIIPYAPENPNFGFALSARGITPERAVSLLLYKHYEIFDQNWKDFYQAPVVSMEG